MQTVHYGRAKGKVLSLVLHVTPAEASLNYIFQEPLGMWYHVWAIPLEVSYIPAPIAASHYFA